jgi:hypothetical protein
MAYAYSTSSRSAVWPASNRLFIVFISTSMLSVKLLAIWLLAICVLRVFQKKSKRGISTPGMELDMIGKRLKEAQKIGQERTK